MKTEGGSKRKLPEVEDPAASAGAIHCHLRRPANRRLAGMPRGEGAGQRFHPGVSLARTPARKPRESGPIQGIPGAGRGPSMSSGMLEADPTPAVILCITRILRTGEITA